MRRVRGIRAFTLLELCISSGLVIVLAATTGGFWRQFPRWSHSLSMRSQQLSEDQLTRAFLVSDLESAAAYDTSSPDRLVLLMGGGPDAPRVEYALEGDRLLRRAWPGGAPLGIARSVSQLQCWTGEGASLQVQIVFGAGTARRALGVSAWRAAAH